MKRVFLSFYLFTIMTFLVIQNGFSPLLERYIESQYDHLMVGYYQELTRGTYFLLIEDLLKLPQSDWERHMEKLRRNFGYPIGVAPMGQIDLAAGELAQLRGGSTVVQGDGDLFYRRIGTSEYALSMGPFEEIDIDSPALLALIYALLAVLMALLSLVWTVPFAKKLKLISTAAKAFGRGDFGIRAQVPARSALSPLAVNFNRMADRIQGLIDGHKELTRAVSHELRTPITRIRFGITMLTDAVKPEDRQRYIDGIQKDVGDLDEMVSELLTYARFDRETPELNLRSYPLGPWLREMVLSAEADHQRIDFRYVNRLANTTATARFEPKHMGRAVSNLLRNAAKYAAYHVVLTLESHGGQWRIHVDDDGPGIPVVDRQRVFEPFTRLDASRSRGSGGYGLGLAIVQRVAIWHGGTATVTKAPTGGARFTIAWPGIQKKHD